MIKKNRHLLMSRNSAVNCKNRLSRTSFILSYPVSNLSYRGCILFDHTFYHALILFYRVWILSLVHLVKKVAVLLLYIFTSVWQCQQRYNYLSTKSLYLKEFWPPLWQGISVYLEKISLLFPFQSRWKHHAEIFSIIICVILRIIICVW